MESVDSTSFYIDQEPYYLNTDNEVQVFESSWKAKLPVMLKGPTGCGKTLRTTHGLAAETTADHRGMSRRFICFRFTGPLFAQA